MIVLCLDPGTRHFGWGVVARVGTRFLHRAHGIIHTDVSEPIAARLVAIEAGLERVLTDHRPTVASVESLFFGRDAMYPLSMLVA